MRRLHSLMGIWLVLYLCEHLFVNALAALLFEDGGAAFIAAVNRIHASPYLRGIEVSLLAIPFLIHGVWGVLYALQGKPNSQKSDGTIPALPQYRRNHAYTWQRITSWVLLVAILAHVVQMRFVNYPERVVQGDMIFYQVVVGGVQLQAPDAGSAFLLMLRETFKSDLMCILYSLFVVAAAYHAFNGLWTWMITWGITLTRKSQRIARTVTTAGMVIVMGMGLFAIWGTWWQG